MAFSDLMRQYLQQLRHETGGRVCEKVIILYYKYFFIIYNAYILGI